MALTKLEERKLNLLEREFGAGHTADTALAAAIRSESICRDLPLSDPALCRFKREQLGYENMALLLERQGA